jgi:hypothetical protein
VRLRRCPCFFFTFGLLVVTSFLLLSSGRARADEPPPKGQWYGAPVLLVDAASLAVALGSTGSGSPGLGYVGAGGYLLGGPVIHIAHRNGDKAVLSLMIRVAAPLAFGYAAYEGFGGSNGEGCCPAIGAVLGGVVGAGLASVVDATTLAWETPRRATAVPVGPTISVGPTHVALGIGGTL